MMPKFFFWSINSKSSDKRLENLGEGSAVTDLLFDYSRCIFTDLSYPPGDPPFHSGGCSQSLLRSAIYQAMQTSSLNRTGAPLVLLLAQEVAGAWRVGSVFSLRLPMFQWIFL